MLTLTLDRTSPEALGTQVATQVRDLVVTGRLERGTRLPSSRALAAELGVARSVIEQAWAQLVAEGWLTGRRGAGTYVAATGLPHPPPARPRAARPADADLVRLDAGTPWIDPRHAALWRRAWREVGAARPPAGYDDHRGLPELRELLAERLGRLRGIALDPDEVRVTGGTTDGLRHVLAALPPGPVLVEDPGYRAAVATVVASGRGVVDHPALEPVDDLRGCAAAYLTPAHQHPLGPAMPGGERLRLLAAARAAGSPGGASAVVVEDDYDSEFRYDVAPIPALAALDRDVVAYLGTASKSVAPSLRLGWLVPPPHLADAVDHHRALTHDTAAWPVQRAFLALLRDGYVDRVVRAARRVYTARAARVADALPGVGQVSGMYATLELDEPTAARAHAAARRAGFDVPLLSTYTRSAQRHGLVVGFGGCTDEQLDRALAAIGDVLSARA